MDRVRLPERHELEAFLVLAEELHFGRTAARLLVTQARVSQTVQRLERRIGAPLFERTSRRVALTPLGEALHAEIAPLYEALAQAVARAADAARGVHGVLRVGFLGIGAGVLNQALTDAFRARCPGCEVELREVHFADPLGPLRSGEVDVLLHRLPVDEPDLTVGPVVLSEPFVLAVPDSHTLARRGSVRLEDLARTTVFGVAGTAPDYWWDFHVPRSTPSSTPVPRGRDVTTFQELLTLIAQGQGVSPMAAHVTRYHSRPGITYVPIEDAPLTEVAPVWRTAAPTARVRAFADAARDAVRANGGPARF
ncbi:MULTISPECIES: LysR family transcriptional regulator [unclassified Streptomyces]|uniref:LysR family transcriptional regulator n=1 Tax=unclassified Streptomyces TaxID=2593676 RepID=UPI0037FAA3D3